LALLHIYRWGAGDDALPHLGAMDGNARVDLETKSHAPAPDINDRDFQQSLKTTCPSDHHRFLVFPGQD